MIPKLEINRLRAGVIRFLQEIQKKKTRRETEREKIKDERI